MKKIVKRLIMLLIIIAMPIILFFTCGLIMYPPDIYFKTVFNNEIRKNDKIEKMFYFYNVPTFWDDNVFDIGLELKDDKRMIIRIEDSIYNVHGILEIGDYAVEVLELNMSGQNSYSNWDGIYYTGGLKHWLLKFILNIPDEYFFDLNNYINCYDEIYEVLEKIYYEERIPGSKEDVIKTNSKIWGDDEGLKIFYDSLYSKWGNDEELMNYSGYIILNEIEGFNVINSISRVKIYVNKK
jgi:hypothetical protein